MEPLPFIDSHDITIAAPADEVFRALAAQVERTPMLGKRGFPERGSLPPRELALAGQHRFARYSLRFVLSPETDGTRVTATTHADFGRGAGRIYRALVIGSGGHAYVVRRFLRQLRASVEKAALTSRQPARS